jgi:hypothetical protein
MMGEEGQSVWRIYASPISPQSLVKSKYFFIIFFSLAVLAITSTLGVFIYQPTLRTTIVVCFEAAFLALAIGAISLSNGISGADFIETPRPRMIRPSASFINLLACFLGGIAILVPFFPYVFSIMLLAVFPSLAGLSLDPFLSLGISAVIAVVLTLVFYRIAVKNAQELLKKAGT